MKCKRIFKVAGALALTVALLVSSAVVSFAANYTTTTTYIDQDTIEVTSTASGLKSGDMATYVAYNNDSFNEANAVYIDQATANETGVVAFTYQTNSDNIKATVKFGGSTVDTAQDATAGGYKVNVKVDTDEAYPVTVAEVADGYEGNLAREIPVLLEAGRAVAKVYVNEEEVPVWYVKNRAVVIYSNAINANGATVTIETKEIEEINVTLGTVKAETGKITAFAKASCSELADFGILIGGEAKLEGATNWDAADDYAVAVKLPALGMGNDGGFCVEVEDTAIDAGTYNVAAYAGTKVTAAKSVVVE